MTRKLNWLGKLPVGTTVYCTPIDPRYSHHSSIHQIVKQARDYTTIQGVHGGSVCGRELRAKRHEERYPLTTSTEFGLGMYVYTSAAEAEDHAERKRLIRLFDIQVRNLSHRNKELPDTFAISAAANILGINLKESDNG